MLFFLNFTGIVMFSTISLIFLKYYNKDYEIKVKSGMFFLVVSGLAFRIIIAPFIRGYGADLSCFTGWSEGVFKSGFANFYSDMSFSDYPPGYIYILYVIAAIRRAFSFETNQIAYNILLKLPAMIADVMCGIVIYKFASKKISDKAGLLLGMIFIFNPMIYLNSSWWGQVDSVFTLLIMIALISLYDGRHIYSAIVYALALIIKPQAVILFPVYIFYIINLVKNEKLQGLKKACISSALGAVLFFILVMPFSPSGNPFWIFDLYIKTLGSYPYASLNTPNFFGLFAGNGKNIYNSFFVFDYNIWSNIFILSICAFSAILYFKDKNGIFSSSAFLIIGMYILSAKMHERYIFPALGILILYYIVSKKKLALLYTLIFSFTAYLATAWVLALDVTGAHPWIPAKAPGFIILSLINVVTFVCFTVWFARNRDSKTVISKPTKPLEVEKMEFNEPLKIVKYTKKELFILVVLILIYTVVAFINLGDAKAPETSWMNKRGDYVVIDIGSIQDINKFNVFNGRKPSTAKDEKNKPASQYKVEISQDGNVYEEAVDFATPGVFKWETHTIDKSARYLKLSVISGKDESYLNEIALYGNKGELIKIQSVKDKDGNTVNELSDEQDKNIFRPTYKNGTYFDEIYHARTAHEHIHGIEAYEWTHPPLGKLIIAIGIKIFGMNPFGWRFMGTFFGILMLPIMYGFTRQIFKDSKLAFFATFLLCFDFMHFTQTRIATIDTYATFFIMLMYYFMYKFYETNYNKENIKNSLKYLFYSGLFFGLGAASKWTCIYAGGGLAVIFAIYMVKQFKEYRKTSLPEFKNDKMMQQMGKKYRRNTISIVLWCVVYFVIIPACIYCLSYLPYAFIEGNSYALKDIWRIQENMYKYHSGLKAEHGFSSQWYTWPLMVRPIWYYTSSIPEKNILSSISAFGNPAVWWTSIAATVSMVYFLYKNIQIKKGRSLNGYNSKYAITVAIFIFVGYLSQYLPWVGVKRVVFIYHYFTSVPFIILIITYVMWQISLGLKSEREKANFRKIIYIYMGIVLALFVIFYPVLSGLEVPKWYVTYCLTWFKTWIFGG